MLVARDGAEVGHLQRRALGRCPADRRGRARDVQGPQPIGEGRAATGSGPHEEAVAVGVVLHDRAAVRTRQPHGAAHDPAQHLVDVQRGADCVADPAEHLELVDLGGELLAPGAQGRHQLDLAHDDGRLGGEGGEQVDLALVEGCASVRHRDNIPITSPFSSIGAHISVR